ncbi:hypothetical protein JCM10207_003791 [Rhodosporidiobolus poonsookiae]
MRHCTAVRAAHRHRTDGSPLHSTASKTHILSSPLRRCLLTNKVLPRALMLRFELVRPPSLAHSSRLFLVPSDILHPRFTPLEQSKGKGLWVTCWREAVETLAKKGSYKRLHGSAVLDPTAATQLVHSQLARRIVQEAEIYAERAKSWPSSADPILSACPVERVDLDDLEARRGAGAGSDRRLLAILDFSPPSSTDTSPPTTPLTSSVDDGTGVTVPRYHLSRFLGDIRLPPAPPSQDAPSPSSTSSKDSLLRSMRRSMNGIVKLWHRRLARQTGEPPETSPTRAPLFLLYAPTPPSPPLSPPSDGDGSSEALAKPAPADDLRRRQAEDLVVFLTALKRCSLWLGEGWDAEAGTAETGTAEGRTQ